MDRAGEPSATAADATATVSRTVEVADVSFRAFLAASAPPRFQWATGDGLEVVGVGAAATLEPGGEDRFGRLRRAAGRAFDRVDHDGPESARPRAFGGMAFFPDHEPGEPWSGFPTASFVVPAAQLVREGERTWLTASAVGEGADPTAVERRLADLRSSLADLPAIEPSGERPGVRGTSITPTEEGWARQVEGAVERIEAGELRKVVLATALAVELAAPADPPAVLERLRRRYPDCYRFLVQPTDGAAFFGATPERLVALSGRSVRTDALGGSAARGETPEADAELADVLRERAKTREEHRLVVDAIREWLAPLGTVDVGERGLRRLSNIQHLHTPIRAELDADAHVLSVVEALHPTPAVGGLPREPAFACIRETEAVDRGWYAGPVGWFDAAGDGEFAVGIRAGVADGDRATLFAGNGIVGDSDPATEWAEVAPKFRPILDELEVDG